MIRRATRWGTALAVLIGGVGCEPTTRPSEASSPQSVPPALVASSATSSATTPPFAGAPSAPSPSNAPVSTASSERPPTVRFASLPVTLANSPCGIAMVVIVNGTANGSGQKLAPRDVFLVHGPAGETVGGPGEAIVVESLPDAPCTVAGERPKSPQIVRTGRTPRPTWAKGAMSAWLDVDATRSPGLYLGRLEGTSAVPEHVHERSWELLAAVEGAGTFTLDGAPARLGPRQVVVVPAGTRHAWTPDPGSKLVAVQLYWPPGPEQRFVELANAEAPPPPPAAHSATPP